MFVKVAVDGLHVRNSLVECRATVTGGPHSHNSPPQEGLSSELKAVNTGGLDRPNNDTENGQFLVLSQADILTLNPAACTV